MVWFYARGLERRSCETRLALAGEGYELVIRDGEHARIERFTELSKLLAREHQLLTAWKAQGWRHAERSLSGPRRGLRPASAV